MPAFSKPFRGVPNGAIYPVAYAVGVDCPPELQRAARSVGALGDETAESDNRSAAELKAALDAKNVTYKGNASKAELLALLAGAGS